MIEIRVCNARAYRSGIDDPLYIIDGSASVDEIMSALEARGCLVTDVKLVEDRLYILYE